MRIKRSAIRGSAGAVPDLLEHVDYDSDIEINDVLMYVAEGSEILNDELFSATEELTRDKK